MGFTAVIDYQMGNVTSVVNGLQACGAEVRVTNRAQDLAQADRVVLPGVGAFGEGMRRLQELSLIPVLEQEVRDKGKPFLGICLGMQLLASAGHEFGRHPGLGWIPGEVKRLQVGTLRLPHVGWNNIRIQRESALLNGLGPDTDFYFVHSYHFAAVSPEDILATCDYGENFAAVVGRGHLMGAQFHPEKSQKAGKILLQNFLKL